MIEQAPIVTDLGWSLMIAELTHRCPLGCPYCSNPLKLESREDELDVAAWQGLFVEAAALGVRQVRLSGGEPGARRDLVEIAASAREAGHHTCLITSGVGIATRTMRDLWEAGLHGVHVSFQDSDAVSADRIAGQKGAFQRKYALATEAVRLGLELTVSFVVHRANMARAGEMIDLALALKAARAEIVDVEYVGWALKNSQALRPSTSQIRHTTVEIERARQRCQGRISVDVIAAPEQRAGDVFTVTPSGKVLPGHRRSFSELVPWNIRDHSLAKILMNLPTTNAIGDVSPGDEVLVVRGCDALENDSGGNYSHRR